MGRIPCWRMGKVVYHVFNRGINNPWILSTPEERDFFHRLLFEQKKHFKIEIYHYVVMSNHFHLTIETLDTKTLSAYLGKISSLDTEHTPAMRLLYQSSPLGLLPCCFYSRGAFSFLRCSQVPTA